MKVMFLCKANVSRSQMAAALYNRLTGTNDADSAGVDVDFPGETLGERKRRLGASHTLELMSSAGIDLSKNKRIQLTKDKLNGYDKIINMYEGLTPEWLTSDPRYEFWDIPDPNGKDIKQTEKTKQMIIEKIQSLRGE